MNDLPANILAKPEQVIPKYCNGMVFNKTEDEKIVISFLFNSKANAVESQVRSVMIETIFIDKVHAQQIIEKLNELLKI